MHYTRQGNDQGTQYASVIFYYDDEQRKIATEVLQQLQGFVDSGKIKGYTSNKITTAILPATAFYPAMDEHQEYLNKNPFGYCNHAFRFKDWPN